jgi:hypothetical protein
MPALILQFLPYLFQAATTIPEIWDFIQKLRTHASQSAEWTAEQEAAFDQQLDQWAKNPPDWWVSKEG